jgi:arylsulfatase A-like enzyme
VLLTPFQCNRATNEKRKTQTSVCTRAVDGQVDVYPTVAALAGLPPPPDIVGRPLNQVGTSLEPVFLDPTVKPGTAKDYAFSEFPQCPGIHPVPGLLLCLLT